MCPITGERASLGVQNDNKMHYVICVWLLLKHTIIFEDTKVLGSIPFYYNRQMREANDIFLKEKKIISTETIV